MTGAMQSTNKSARNGEERNRRDDGKKSPAQR